MKAVRWSRARARRNTHNNASLERLEQTRRAVHRETREAYLGVVTKISAVKAFGQAVVSSQTALESTRAGFEVERGPRSTWLPPSAVSTRRNATSPGRATTTSLKLCA